MATVRAAMAMWLLWSLLTSNSQIEDHNLKQWMPKSPKSRQVQTRLLFRIVMLYIAFKKIDKPYFFLYHSDCKVHFHNHYPIPAGYENEPNAKFTTYRRQWAFKCVNFHTNIMYTALPNKINDFCMSMECSFEVKLSSSTGFGWFSCLAIPGAVHKWWSHLQFKLTKFLVWVLNICIKC